MLAVLLTAGCASSAQPSRQVVAHTQLSLEDFEIVSSDDVDLHTAVQTREAVESEFVKNYGGQKGQLRWFFHAFDGTNLDFVVARTETAPGTGARYVALRRLRVKRSPDAERALGVTHVLATYGSAQTGRP